MTVYKKPDGSTIELNENPLNTQLAERLGWKKATVKKAPAKKAAKKK